MEKPFFNLAPDSLGRQVVEIDLPAGRDGLGIDGEFEPGRKLHRPQHPETILNEGRRVDQSDDPFPKVGLTGKGIDHLGRQWIKENGVDGEVAPPRRLLVGHEWIAGDDKTTVATPDLRLTPRQTNIDDERPAVVAQADFVDGVGGPDWIDRSVGLEQLPEWLGREVVDFQIVVSPRTTAEGVADPSANEERTSTGSGDGATKLEDRFIDEHLESSTISGSGPGVPGRIRIRAARRQRRY